MAMLLTSLWLDSRSPVAGGPTARISMQQLSSHGASPIADKPCPHGRLLRSFGICASAGVAGLDQPAIDYTAPVELELSRIAIAAYFRRGNISRLSSGATSPILTAPATPRRSRTSRRRNPGSQHNACQRTRLCAGSATALRCIALFAIFVLTACNQTTSLLSVAGEASAGESRSAANYGARSNEEYPVPAVRADELDPKYMRQRVRYPTAHPAGTIVVDPDAKFLYLVMAGGVALRYGIGVGREGFGWSGEARIARKARWPSWTPPAEMIRRQPALCAIPQGHGARPRKPAWCPRAVFVSERARHALSHPWNK